MNLTLRGKGYFYDLREEEELLKKEQDEKKENKV